MNTDTDTFFVTSARRRRAPIFFTVSQLQFILTDNCFCGILDELKH